MSRKKIAPARELVLMVAAETGCDVRTVRRVLSGQPSRSLAVTRAIEESAEVVRSELAARGER